MSQLAGPQKDSHRSSYASSADPTARAAQPHAARALTAGTRPLPPDKHNTPPGALHAPRTRPPP